SAIEIDEFCAAARAVIVNPTRENAFSSAGLALNENGTVALRDSFGLTSQRCNHRIASNEGIAFVIFLVFHVDVPARYKRKLGLASAKGIIRARRGVWLQRTSARKSCSASEARRARTRFLPRPA